MVSAIIQRLENGFVLGNFNNLPGAGDLELKGRRSVQGTFGFVFAVHAVGSVVKSRWSEERVCQANIHSHDAILGQEAPAKITSFAAPASEAATALQLKWNHYNIAIFKRRPKTSIGF